jgi:hypothetical protein
MREFITLVTQIFIITLVQIVIEVFMDASKNPYQAKLLNIACFTGSLYLLINFVFNILLKELNTVVKFPF